MENPSGPNLFFKYQDTILFTAPDGTSLSGIDPDATGHLSYAGFPELPVATFPGDGFGGAGPGGKSVTVDSEGLYVNDDGSFWVSDEFGPYICKRHATFVLARPLTSAQIYSAMTERCSLLSGRPRPSCPGATAPLRFPPITRPSIPMAARATTWIQRTQSVAVLMTMVRKTETEIWAIIIDMHTSLGFEALSVSDGGKTLWVLLQTAGVQEGVSSMSRNPSIP